MSKKFMASATLAGLLIATGSSAQAAELFSADILIDKNSRYQIDYDNILELIAQYSAGNLRKLNNYNKTSEIDATINLRGWQGVRIFFAEQSNVLELSIPSIDLKMSFGSQNMTRNEARKALLEFLRNGDNKDILEKITREVVKNSPVDPIIGNPASLTHSMVVGSFEMSSTALQVAPSMNNVQQRLHLGTESASSSNIADSRNSVIVFNPKVGHYSQQGIDTTVISLPLSYATWLTQYDVGLSVDAPITMTKTDQAEAWSGSLGVGLNFMLNPDWYIMPVVKIGLAGSNDLGTSAAVYSLGVNNTFVFYPSQHGSLNITNSLGYYKTEPVKLDDYTGSYNLENFVVRNGIEYNQRTSYFFRSKPVNLNAKLSRTDYTGDEIYSSYSHDISVSLGVKNPDPKGLISEYHAGLSYTFGEGDIDGVSFGMSYLF